MGAILEPTPDMGSWQVEVRDESAYLKGDTRVLPGRGFAFALSEADHVLAAVDQIMTHSYYREWATANLGAADNVWIIQLVDEWVRVLGPIFCYGGHDGSWTTGTVELTYASLATLRTVLTIPTRQVVPRGET